MLDDGARTDDAKFRLMFERSADAILLLDTASNTFVEYNQAALDMLRCTRVELRSLHPSKLSPPLQPDGRLSFDKANEMITTAVRSGSHRFEWMHRSPHRPDFPVEVLLTPIQVGHAPMLLVVWRDVTERKRAEEALRQAQKLESLGMLAGGIAHDFNNLLTAICGHVALAREDLSQDHPALAHLDQAAHAALSAANLTRQMLAYSGRGTFLVQPLDACEAVREIAGIIAVSVPKRVRMVEHLPPGLPLIDADRAQIQQIVMNLITNAAEAIGDAEGRIALSAHAVELDEEAVRVRFGGQDVKPGPHVVLEVEDDGCGMSPEMLARIFDPFFSTKQAGRGLGLSALQGIVKAHGAGLVVDSEAGRGTMFRICFPVSTRAAAAPSVSLRERGVPPTGQGTVLLVDDEDMVRGVARAMLERLGFSVLESADGESAQAVFRANRERISWVLMDLTMPHVDGHEAFLGLRRLAPSLPVVLASGWAEVHLVERFAETPPSAFLPKPFTLEELDRVLRRAGLLPASPE